MIGPEVAFMGIRTVFRLKQLTVNTRTVASVLTWQLYLSAQRLLMNCFGVIPLICLNTWVKWD
ncbi:hypothetical protein XM38_019540 [Halomicronema hongdechloris C2206]|uniref:Uncharacterized protein n=1 Tax=Halomicronema hongdechloris C2206 TaxID=1641165 RepID=A0A1Z3HL42_9CYAN|nr:hypothetical protein XM38_019540 [Halomicronema hongdechloris C2206]